MYVCIKVNVYVYSVKLITMLHFQTCGSMPFDDSNIKKMVKDQLDKKVAFPKSKKLADPCRDLIVRILESNIKKRLTMGHILEHGWIPPTQQQ